MEDKMLTLQQFYQKHDKLGEGEVILDVRTPDEFAAGHVPGSFNISHESVAAHAAELDQHKKVYIYCRRGGRAQTAFETLTDLGLENLYCVHDAGMLVWEEKGYPLKR